jgi:hypothetical protein
MFRPPQALRHVDEHGVGEARPVPGVVTAAAARVSLLRIEAEPLDRLAVRESIEPLEHHDHSHHGRGYRPPSPLVEGVAEGLVGEEVLPLTVQERVDRTYLDSGA